MVGTAPTFRVPCLLIAPGSSLDPRPFSWARRSVDLPDHLYAQMSHNRNPDLDRSYTLTPVSVCPFLPTPFTRYDVVNL